MKECRSPYCECDKGCCTAPGFVDARHINQGEDMTHVTFTKEQMEWLSTYFDITSAKISETLPVRDGYVFKDSKLWWHGEFGPKRVTAISEWNNIYTYPEVYSVEEPKYRIVYDYEE